MGYEFKFMVDTFHGTSKKTKEEKDFFVVRLALYKDNTLIRKGEPLIWLTEEQYKDYLNISK